MTGVQMSDSMRHAATVDFAGTETYATLTSALHRRS